MQELILVRLSLGFGVREELGCFELSTEEGNSVAHSVPKHTEADVLVYLCIGQRWEWKKVKKAFTGPTVLFSSVRLVYTHTLADALNNKLIISNNNIQTTAVYKQQHMEGLKKKSSLVVEGRLMLNSC